MSKLKIAVLFALPEQEQPLQRSMTQTLQFASRHFDPPKPSQDADPNARIGPFGFRSMKPFDLYSAPEFKRLMAQYKKLAPSLLELVSRLTVRVSGAGVENSERAIRELLNSEMEFSALLICGFGVGLAPELGVGDLLVANAVEDRARDNGNVWPCSPSLIQRVAEMQEAGKLKNARLGTLATLPDTLRTTEEGLVMRQSTSALAFDRESAGAAKVAVEKGIPWLAVRAITHSVSELCPLDFHQYVDAFGNPDNAKITAAVLRRPSLLRVIREAGKRSDNAAKGLNEFLLPFCREFPA